MKNTIKAMTLAAVLMFGSTFAMADGIIIGDSKEKGCGAKETNAIIIGDRSVIGGIFEALEGIIIGDTKDTPCLDKEGIIVSDTPGIIIGDAPGIIIGD